MVLNCQHYSAWGTRLGPAVFDLPQSHFTTCGHHLYQHIKKSFEALSNGLATMMGLPNTGNTDRGSQKCYRNLSVRNHNLSINHRTLPLITTFYSRSYRPQTGHQLATSPTSYGPMPKTCKRYIIHAGSGEDLLEEFSILKNSIAAVLKLCRNARNAPHHRKQERFCDPH